MQLLLLAILCQCPEPPAPASVRIVGPSRVAPSEFARLTVRFGAGGLSVDSLDGAAEGDSFAGVDYRWLLADSDKDFFEQLSRRGPELTFVTPDERTYTFVFVCHAGGKLMVATHVLEVGAPRPPTPGPPDPQPSPNPSRFGITGQARQWVQEVPPDQRSQGAAFAGRLEMIAQPILDGSRTRLPQELLDDMIAAAKDLGAGWAGFRGRLQSALDGLIKDRKLATSRDVAEMLVELAAGVK